MPHHSMELWPPNDAATVASAPPSRDPDAQPSARCFFVYPAAAVPCSSSAEVRAGPRAPRLSPGPAYTPRSASPVGLARTAVIPQNNSTSDCYICDPVVLGRCVLPGDVFARSSAMDTLNGSAMS